MCKGLPLASATLAHVGAAEAPLTVVGAPDLAAGGPCAPGFSLHHQLVSRLSFSLGKGC